MSAALKVVAETAIVIEKGVPIPSLGPRNTYPFGQMEIGDSFLTEVPCRKIATAASYYGTRNGKKFTVRTEGNGFRVWRIA